MLHNYIGNNKFVNKKQMKYTEAFKQFEENLF